MAIVSWIKHLIGSKKTGYLLKYDDEGINFILPPDQKELLSRGDADQLLMHQHVILRMLVEEDSAELLPNGILIPSCSAVQLDENTRSILGLPEKWGGKLKADVCGKTGSSSFKIVVMASNVTGQYSHGFSVEGAVIDFSDTQRYLLTPAHHLIFTSLQEHSSSEKKEYDNLKLLYSLQKAQEMGAEISLGHFEKLKIFVPESITISAELDDQNQLVLTPFMGQNSSNERIQKVLGQLHTETVASLRVDNEIILFDENKLKAVHEILNSRVVPKEKVKEFLEKPTAFLDGSLVNLDIGFSARVKGVTSFRHAYFGETDESGINWFSEKFAAKDINPIGELKNCITDRDDLDSFKEEYEKAIATGANEVSFDGKVFDISDRATVIQKISTLENLLSGVQPERNPEDGDFGKLEDDENREPVIVDIELNDDVLSCPSPSLNRDIYSLDFGLSAGIRQS